MPGGSAPSPSQHQLVDGLAVKVSAGTRGPGPAGLLLVAQPPGGFIVVSSLAQFWMVPDIDIWSFNPGPPRAGVQPSS